MITFDSATYTQKGVSYCGNMNPSTIIFSKKKKVLEVLCSTVKPI